MSESVKVFVRFRPMIAREQTRGVWEVSDRSVTGMDHQFTFDYVFGMSHSQAHVYEQIGIPIVQQVLDGFNACVLSFGQTGSGKTFSTFGDLSKPSLHGLIPRIVHAILTSNQDPEVEQSAEISYNEIYQEGVFDLLNTETRRGLKLRENEKPKEVYVEGTKVVTVTSVQECLNVLAQGDQQRSFAATKMNDRSSRSHAIVTLRLTRTDKRNQRRKTSRLFLVDLAGSEWIERSGVVGQGLEEAKKINKSLSTLAHVIQALTTERGHVPYRDSKLTYLLSDALGGNSKTALLLACSPAMDSMRETLSTLQFGQRAKMIKNTPKVNEEISIKGYQMLIASLQERIQLLEAGAPTRTADQEDVASLKQRLLEEEAAASVAKREVEQWIEESQQQERLLKAKEAEAKRLADLCESKEKQLESLRQQLESVQQQRRKSVQEDREQWQRLEEQTKEVMDHAQQERNKRVELEALLQVLREEMSDHVEERETLVRQLQYLHQQDALRALELQRLKDEEQRRVDALRELQQRIQESEEFQLDSVARKMSHLFQFQAEAL